MSRWTNGPKEMSHVKDIIVSVLPFTKVIIALKDGSHVTAIVTGSRIESDAGDHNGLATSVIGEIRLRLPDGSQTTINPLDVAHVMRDPN